MIFLKEINVFLITGVLAGLLLLPGSARAGLDEAIATYRAGDHKKAYAALLPLAEGGDPVAQFTLGYMHEYGQVNGKDLAEAAKWYGLSAGQGNEFAQVHLGTLYLTGSGVPKDEETALVWYRKAAEKGNKSALFLLAEINKFNAINSLEKAAISCQLMSGADDNNGKKFKFNVNFANKTMNGYAASMTDKSIIFRFNRDIIEISRLTGQFSLRFDKNPAPYTGVCTNITPE